MNEQDIEKIVAYAVGDRDLVSREIPSIELYLDQIISLVSEKNVGATDMYAERTLTSTMINNYSKDGLVAPIKGKKYSKEHIIQMLLVYSLKSTLSISSIRRILHGAYNAGFDGAALTEGYDAFIEGKEFNRGKALEIVNEYLSENDFDINDERDFFVFLLGLTSLSSYLKNIAIALLNDHYPDIDELRRKELEIEKERIREEKRRAKEEKEQREKAEKEEKEKKEKAEKEAKEEKERVKKAKKQEKESEQVDESQNP